MEMKPALNVFGETLQSCSTSPMTGFFRDGCCNTSKLDGGSHTVCTILTAEFLDFSKRQGNDLITPRPEYGFPGLKPGDSWCLCASRWRDAFKANCAPRVRLQATHLAALDIIPLAELKQFAADLN